jgi:hypothetical protein
MGPLRALPGVPSVVPERMTHASMHSMSQTAHMPANLSPAPGLDMLGLLSVSGAGSGVLLAPALRLLPILLVLAI